VDQIIREIIIKKYL